MSLLLLSPRNKGKRRLLGEFIFSGLLLFKPEANILGSVDFGSGLVSNCGIAGTFSFGSALIGDPASGLDYSFTTADSLPSGTSLTRASTGRYYNSSGYVAERAIDTARFDYNPATLGLRGILIEPQSTNEAKQSGFYTGWSLQGATWGTNGTSPDNASNAACVTESTASTNHATVYFTALTYVTATTYTKSCYLKKGTASIIGMDFSTGAFYSPGYCYCTFNLDTGVKGTPSNCTAEMVDVGNGWYRCSITATSNDAGEFSSGYIYFTNEKISAGRNPSYTGTGKTFYCWGMQISKSSKATSYIPTTTANVTRGADALTFTIPSGISTLRYTFDDDTTQDVAVSAGSYTVPTDLNRAWIKRIQSV